MCNVEKILACVSSINLEFIHVSPSNAMCFKEMIENVLCGQAVSFKKEGPGDQRQCVRPFLRGFQTGPAGPPGRFGSNMPNRRSFGTCTIRALLSAPYTDFRMAAVCLPARAPPAIYCKVAATCGVRIGFHLCPSPVFQAQPGRTDCRYCAACGAPRPYAKWLLINILFLIINMK